MSYVVQIGMGGIHGWQPLPWPSVRCAKVANCPKRSDRVEDTLFAATPITSRPPHPRAVSRSQFPCATLALSPSLSAASSRKRRAPPSGAVRNG